MKACFRLVCLNIVFGTLLFLSGCSPYTEECGGWSFVGNVPSITSGMYIVTNSFQFSPSTTCGKNCNCDTDCMIQMVFVYTGTEQSNVFAGSAESDSTFRTTGGSASDGQATGWFIDRLDGYGYGYYGLLNDGQTFDQGDPPGNNNKATILNDQPGYYNSDYVAIPNVFFAAVDVAVCFKTNTCASNSILGYYYWSWSTDENGNTSAVYNGPAWVGLDTQFQNAVAAWNMWAPTSGPETAGSPMFPSLPHAVCFPRMADL